MTKCRLCFCAFVYPPSVCLRENALVLRGPCAGELVSTTVDFLLRCVLFRQVCSFQRLRREQVVSVHFQTQINHACWERYPSAGKATAGKTSRCRRLANIVGCQHRVKISRTATSCAPWAVSWSIFSRFNLTSSLEAVEAKCSRRGMGCQSGQGPCGGTRMHNNE